ncbi:MAG TPA: glycosyltransferase [Robiginitalea sp.]|nr:glycosyltransferase [Robiginitalea sp.]
MKILLTSIGTRGDMEPFLALGELLKKAGHETVCLMPEQFRPLAEEGGHAFETMGPEFMEMLESDLGKLALGGSGTAMQKFSAYRRLQKEYASINIKLMQRQYEVINRIRPDRIVHSAKVIYPVVWGLENPGQTITASPIPYVLHAVRSFSHVAFNRNLGPFLNGLSYKLALWGLTRHILKTSKILPLAHHPAKATLRRALLAEKAIYTVSPTLFAKPAEWPDHINVLGYHERDKTVQWQPDAALLAFLEKHPKLLMVTFGSMTSPDPAKNTQIVLASLEKAGIPALVNTAAGGLVEPAGYNRDQFHFINAIPYDWVLPRLYGLVHHGGSGTTHMAVKYGCVSLIVPHIIDQFLWNTVLSQKGVGPKGPGITKISEARLVPLLKDLWENPGYKSRARELAAGMAGEDYAQEVVRCIEERGS